MHLYALLLNAALLPTVLGIPPRDVSLAELALVVERALPNSPSGGYAPKIVPCPAKRPTIRDANSLSPEETEWLKLRRKETVDPMIAFLKRANIADFDAEAYIRKAAGNISALPNIGIAASGGGYRALMNGAGFVAAADSRTAGATDKGGIGGLLQSSTYLSGLSGGGWMVGSIMLNNFSTVETLRDGSPDSSVWQFSNSIFTGPDESGINVVNTATYWADVIKEVGLKDEAGFETSLTDFWGRALSYQLINAPEGGPAYTFSSIALTDGFAQGKTPFPILVADGRAPGEKIISLNATVYEFNAFEMGSFDPTTAGFVPTRYIASNFSGGVVPTDGNCVEGFDQAGFVMGTSSSLFNVFLLQNISAVESIPSFVTDALVKILTNLDSSENDIAQYVPNPFFGWSNDTNPTANSAELDLVDGGEDLQNIPLAPLLQPLRNVDVIFAVDSSADTIYNWPNATALRATYDRSLEPIANGILFPPVPDANTFINLGLNNRPTFFGCDVANFSLKAGQSPPPLIVYIPNAPYTASSNVSTFTPSYTDEVRNAIIQNGLNAGSQGNGTLDERWPTCVACAVLSRSLVRTGTAVPSACAECFTRYCWDGKIDSADKGSYEPPFKIGNGTAGTADKSGAAVSRPAAWSVLVAIGVMVSVAALLG